MTHLCQVKLFENIFGTLLQNVNMEFGKYFPVQVVSFAFATACDPVGPAEKLLRAIPVGIGQVMCGCDNPWTENVLLRFVHIMSPLICLHAAIGSAIGMLAG